MRIWLCFCPSALRIADSRWPSAVRIMARFSRSAFICRSIDSWIDGGRVDGLDLDAGDADAPAAGDLVQLAAQHGVDLVAGGQRLLEAHPADHVAQGRGGGLLDAVDVVGDLVDRGLGVGDLVVDDGVDVDRQVVLGDHRLRREGAPPARAGRSARGSCRRTAPGTPAPGPRRP